MNVTQSSSEEKSSGVAEEIRLVSRIFSMTNLGAKFGIAGLLASVAVSAFPHRSLADEPRAWKGRVPYAHRTIQGAIDEAEDDSTTEIRPASGTSMNPLKLMRRFRADDRLGEKTRPAELSIRREPITTAVNTAPAEGAATSDTDALVEQANQAIEHARKRYLSVETHTPWQIIHGVLAYRRDYQVRENGKLVNAIDWISKGATYQNEPWFEKTQFGGRGHPFTVAYAFEGHPNQFLGYMTMSDLPVTHKIKAGQHTITIADILNNAKMEINANEEVTWTLWAFSHYLHPDAKWQNKYGETWSMERIVQVETNVPIQNAACGGTHSLFALTNARNAYTKKVKKPLRGAWLEADQKIRRHVAIARANQNPDGTLSSNFFNGRGFSNEFETRIGTTGHQLEFIIHNATDEELKDEWIRRAVGAVAKDLIDNRRVPCECGALYHAINSLTLYRDRMTPKKAVFNPPTPKHRKVDPEKDLIEKTGDKKGEKTPAKSPKPAVTNPLRNDAVGERNRLEIPSIDTASSPLLRVNGSRSTKKSEAKLITPGEQELDSPAFDSERDDGLGEPVQIIPKRDNAVGGLNPNRDKQGNFQPPRTSFLEE